MEITIQWWHILIAISVVFAGLMFLESFRKKICIVLGIIVGSCILLSLPLTLTFMCLELYSKNTIHKYADFLHKSKLTAWEKITLQKIPMSELKRRVQAEEDERQKYLSE